MTPDDYSVDGLTPCEVVSPTTYDEAASMLAAASQAERGVIIWGGGTRMATGNIPRRYDIALSTRSLDQIVDYQPADMTVTVQAGMLFSDLQRCLAEHGQFLPWNPPHLEQATLGGIIATNDTGGWRYGYGTPRDRILQARIALTDGTVIRGGAPVVKSVAGYDLPRLFCGSWGTIGAIVEVTLKVQPLPEARSLLAVELGLAELEPLLAAVMASQLEPVCVDWMDGQLVVEFHGLKEDVEWQRAVFGKMWRGSTATGETPMSQAVVIRYLMPSSRVAAACAEIKNSAKDAGIMAHAASGIVYMGSDAPEAPSVLATLGQAWECKYRFDRLPIDAKSRIAAWHDGKLPLELMTGIKRAFDPAGVLSPGRYVGGL